MIPFILGALAAVGLSELSKRNKPKMADGGGVGKHFVGVFNEQQLKNKEDKKAIEKAQKETGLKYIDSKIIKKGGKMFMEVYLVDKYAKGGGVGYTERFKEVADFGNEQYYIRKWGKVSTDKKDNVELLAVAQIRDLEEYVSEDELPQEGNFELDITLVPIEKHISKKHKSSANDDSVSMGGNTIVNIVNYMGGLNYEPQEKVFFKTFDEAHKYLMSKELNDKISAQGMMSGFIMDMKYNRAGQSNWQRLYYMMGLSDKF